MQTNARQIHSSNTSGNTLSTGSNRLGLDHHHHSSLSTTEMDEHQGINVPEAAVQPRFISNLHIKDQLFFFYQEKSTNPSYLLMSKAIVIVTAFIIFYIMKNS